MITGLYCSNNGSQNNTTFAFSLYVDSPFSGYCNFVDFYLTFRCVISYALFISLAWLADSYKIVIVLIIDELFWNKRVEIKRHLVLCGRLLPTIPSAVMCLPPTAYPLLSSYGCSILVELPYMLTETKIKVKSVQCLRCSLIVLQKLVEEACTYATRFYTDKSFTMSMCWWNKWHIFNVVNWLRFTSIKCHLKNCFELRVPVEVMGFLWRSVTCSCGGHVFPVEVMCFLWSSTLQLQ